MVSARRWANSRMGMSAMCGYINFSKLKAEQTKCSFALCQMSGLQIEQSHLPCLYLLPFKCFQALHL